MAVIKVNKNKDYTIMSNRHFKEKEMSLKAKGLLSLMLSLPPNWDYSISGLVAICKENESAIKTTLAELKKFGYLVVTKKMPNETTTGRIDYIYDIYELPQEKQEVEKQEVEKQEVEKQEVENQPLEFQGVENQGQLNTNELNINELSKDNKKERKTTYDKIIDDRITDADLKGLIYEFIKMRKMKKKPLTDLALTRQLDNLMRLSNDIEEQKEIVGNSIDSCWDKFYPLKKGVSNVQGNTKRNGDEYAFLG